MWVCKTCWNKHLVGDEAIFGYYICIHFICQDFNYIDNCNMIGVVTIMVIATYYYLIIEVCLIKNIKLTKEKAT